MLRLVASESKETSFKNHFRKPKQQQRSNQQSRLPKTQANKAGPPNIHANKAGSPSQQSTPQTQANKYPLRIPLDSQGCFVVKQFVMFWGFFHPVAILKSQFVVEPRRKLIWCL